MSTLGTIVADPIHSLQPVSNAEYIRKTNKRGDPDRPMSRSDLGDFAENPHKWVLSKDSSDRSRATDFGSVFDCLVTEHEGSFAERFIAEPAIYPATPKRKDDEPEEKPWNMNATYCKTWVREREAAGVEVVKGDLVDSARIARDTLFRSELVPGLTGEELIRQCRKQVYICGWWVDAATGLRIPIKVLIDLLPSGSLPQFFRDHIIDLKSARNGNPQQWNNVVMDHGYHWQAAMQLDAWNALAPIIGEPKRHDFAHLVAESAYPYENALMPLSADFISLGRMEYQAALAKLARCYVTNEWPGYEFDGYVDGHGLTVIDPPLWALKRMEAA